MADDTPETMPDAPAGTPAQTSAAPPVDTMADPMAEPTTDGPADLMAEDAGAATVEPGGGESGTDPSSAGPREGDGEADAPGGGAAATPLESQPAPSTPAEPEPAPAAEPPAPAAAPEPEAAPAVVAATLEVPPLPGSSTGQPPSGEGGEWELLTGKVRQWLASGQLQNLWAQARTPLTALAVLTGLIVVLRIYSALLAAIDSVPLASGLLELTGVLWLARYGLPRLVRSQERQQLISTVRQRWETFFGRR